jgi:hypothetical protein
MTFLSWRMMLSKKNKHKNLVKKYFLLAFLTKRAGYGSGRKRKTTESSGQAV